MSLECRTGALFSIDVMIHTFLRMDGLIFVPNTDLHLPIESMCS